jgi:glycerol-3-phosphate acyltransferase PlsY
MEFLAILGSAILAYLAGSIPFGLLVTYVATGKDVRETGSGRTGGTNVMRAAGWLAGGITAFFDVMKAVASGWIVGWLAPGSAWAMAAAALAAVLGTIHSVFLARRDENGNWKLPGGAGGAATLGTAIALWPPSLYILLPFGALVYLLVGYASITSLSASLLALVIFGYRVVIGLDPWQYSIYGLGVVALVVYALRPNFKRLRAGTERTVGLRAYFQKRAEKRKLE